VLIENPETEGINLQEIIYQRPIPRFIIETCIYIIRTYISIYTNYKINQNTQSTTCKIVEVKILLIS
jgi:hypothetical protein